MSELILDAADDWAALRREYISLRHKDKDSTGPTVGHVAGEPELPDSLAWPTDSHDRPMQHLMTLDLAALPRVGLDLPASGRLVFFLDEEYAEPSILFFDDPAALRPRAYPESFRWVPDARIDLVAATEPCWPEGDHPYLARFPKGHFDGVPREDPPEPLLVADHRIGGYTGVGVQYDFDCAPDSTLPEGLGAEAENLPILLAQLDYDPDAGMGWGDCGNAHWSISRPDLAARRFDAAEFSWSCH
ncbi:DUF1963 domain-containing protein [Glycomyces paridis]|uniref:DUF1963 domain-containing protein n=1 Tax=Glycomyces paridis TaxID=2126555 RepID=A0A4S8PHR9_9ACTN|nr:YwqG family protein [Glycomyces paridis]THV30158.1 DUF1963 domain-containing protein [Glycomyces paridis]